MTAAPAAELAVVGVSVSGACGVRDHALLLAGELEREGFSCAMHWLERQDLSLRGSRAEFRDWIAQLSEELVERPPRAVLFHYSVFSYSHKGVPLFAGPVARMLARAPAPVVGILHEMVYPWGRGGARGRVWALTQRVLLVDVMRSCDAAIVTAQSRSRWLASRPWLPRRPVLVAPVFPNLPPPAPVVHDSGGRPVVGIFGYSYEGVAMTLVLDALRALGDRGSTVELLLLGATGASSPAGERWLAEAARHGMEGQLAFTGELPAQELSDELARCEVLLFPDTAGPSSRKGSLAAALASGAPVVALDGANTWEELSRRGALRLVAPDASALRAALVELLGDERARHGLGARGRAFAEEEMSLARTAEVVRTLLDQVAQFERAVP